jgi:hypothetical protein
MEKFNEFSYYLHERYPPKQQGGARVTEHSPLVEVEHRYGPLTVYRPPWAAMQHGDYFDACLLGRGSSAFLAKSFYRWQSKTEGGHRFYFRKQKLPNSMTRVTLLDQDVI